MQRLEVSGVVRPIYGSLGVKRLRSFIRIAYLRNNYMFRPFSRPSSGWSYILFQATIQYAILRWRGRNRKDATNLMFIIRFYLNMFRASLCPSSGEQACALPHMVRSDIPMAAECLLTERLGLFTIAILGLPTFSGVRTVGILPREFPF